MCRVSALNIQGILNCGEKNRKSVTYLPGIYMAYLFVGINKEILHASARNILGIRNCGDK
jgi:hypothetical protein